MAVVYGTRLCRASLVRQLSAHRRSRDCSSTQLLACCLCNRFIAGKHLNLRDILVACLPESIESIRFLRYRCFAFALKLFQVVENLANSWSSRCCLTTIQNDRDWAELWCGSSFLLLCFVDFQCISTLNTAHSAFQPLKMHLESLVAVLCGLHRVPLWDCSTSSSQLMEASGCQLRIDYKHKPDLLSRKRPVKFCCAETQRLAECFGGKSK